MTHSTRSRVANALRAAAPPAVIAFATATIVRFPPGHYGFYPQCPFHQLLSLQCPGCGATRALTALLHGQIAVAIHFNALATMLFPVVAVYGIFVYARFLRRKRHPLAESSASHYLYGVSFDRALRNYAKPSLVLAKTQNGSSTSRSRPLLRREV